MEKEKISVIIPIYNVERYLKRCIESVINQTYKNIEIILINDGSLDNCGEICDEYSLKDNRIKVIHQKNKGLAETRNIGLKHSSGNIITFIDSDDYISHDMISKLYYNMINEDAEISACGHFQIYDSGNIEVNCKKSIKKVFDTKKALSKFMFTQEIDVVSWNKLYRKYLFEGIKFPTGKLYEDHYTIYKVIDKAKRVVYTSEPLYYYCKRKTSIGGSDFSQRTLELKDALEEECMYIIAKYPDIRKEIELSKAIWLMVIYNKMILVNYREFEFEKYLKKAIIKVFPYFIISSDILITKKIQLFLYIFNKKIYKFFYIKFIEKYR